MAQHTKCAISSSGCATTTPAAAAKRRSGFYGIDLYSLFTSIQAVLAYLDRIDPEAARKARARYACFDHAREDSQAYGYSAGFGLTASCEDEVVQQLREMNRRAAEVSQAPGLERDAAFYAQQNARLVRNAEEYYRTMFRGRVSSWNLRDSHMVETLQALERQLSGDRRSPPRIAVWAHNSHLGDASATEMGNIGEWNVGQLVRDRYGDEAVLVGFSTYRGWVTAADEWDEPPQRKQVREGLAGSWEDIFHETDTDRLLLVLRGDDELRSLIATPRRLQRAIGVIYRPETERQSHYFYTRLAEQFDAMIHIDETHALEPLDRGRGVEHRRAAGNLSVGCLIRFMPANSLQQAVQFAIDHESTWDRDVNGVWGVHREDPPPWNRLLGPVHSRGPVSGDHRRRRQAPRVLGRTETCGPDVQRRKDLSRVAGRRRARSRPVARCR